MKCSIQYKIDEEINILTVISQYIYEILLHTHKHLDSFMKKGDVHGINTRNKHKRNKYTKISIKESKWVFYGEFCMVL